MIIWYNGGNTKRIFSAIAVSVVVFFFLLCVPKNSFATQSFDVCYSQCAAYKFVWHGDTCWDLFQNQCSSGSGNGFIQTIRFLKDVKSLLVKGDGVENVFKAFFVCKPLINDCIVPQLRDCKQTCQIDTMVYAPDISVGHPESSLRGVFYDEKSHQLYFKVVNNGLAYAWDIDVEATYSHTKSRDQVPAGTRLFKEKIDELIYLGARNGPPKTLNDYVTDFLIDEAQSGQFLQGFKSWLLSDQKSDSKNYNVPNYWIKALPFTPVDGELNRIVLKVDGTNATTETNELNNTYTLDIDLRPTPARFQIESFLYKRVDQTLASFMIHFQVRNTGEENGNAHVAIFEGKRESGKTPLFQTDQVVQGKNAFLFDKNISIDLSKEQQAFCGKLKQYQLVVTDKDGNTSVRDFSLPIYLGSISGRVTDLFGKKIVGATITASSGQQTTVNDSGIYHLNKIDSLGNVTVTAFHPSYSQPESRTVKFKIDNELNPCVEGSLAFYGVNFILKDKPVSWKVIFKDQQGHPLEGTVTAYNSLFRHVGNITGEKVFPDVQPGKYDVTFLVSGYYPQFKNLALVPPETVTEIVFEKIGGRENDDGLRIVTPRLLWKRQLGGIIGNLAATKDGKLLVVYSADNKTKQAVLTFFDPLTGKVKKSATVPYTISEQRNVGLDASFDGRTVGLFVNPGAPGKTDKERILKLFNAEGATMGETTANRRSSIFLDVSPDGFFLYLGKLVNSSLHKYTRKEIEGVGEGRDLQGYGSFVHFLRNGNLISGCKGGEQGLCERTIPDVQVKQIIQTEGAPRVIDESRNGMTIIRTDKKLYAVGGATWVKDVRRDSSFASASVSPGGMYTMVAEGNGSNTLLTLKIFGNTGGDKTPEYRYRDVRLVSANDKGLFFAQISSGTIEYYQVGVYESPNFITTFFKMIGQFFAKF